MEHLSKFDLRHFYPRPPRGGRPYRDLIIAQKSPFLSTPSARRATPKYVRLGADLEISIHALREEGDIFQTNAVVQNFLFLSTPSARRATAAHPVRQRRC